MPQFDFVLTAVETNFVSSSHISLPLSAPAGQYFHSQPTELLQNFLFQSPETSAQVPEKRFYWKDDGQDAKNIEHKKYGNEFMVQSIFQIHYESRSVVNNNMARLTRWGELTNDRSEVKVVAYRPRQATYWVDSRNHPSLTNQNIFGAALRFWAEEV